MGEVTGIKETKEVILGLSALAPLIIKQVKDGVSISDAVELYAQVVAHPEVKAALVAAIDNIKAVPEELKDLSAAEGVELAVLGAQNALVIVQALKA